MAEDKPGQRVVSRRMSEDIGEMLNSPSTAFMTLVDCDHENDFDKVCEYLAEHAQEVGHQQRQFALSFTFKLSLETMTSHA